MLKWNDCQAMPFASTFVGHRTISSILEVLALLLVYERCARCVLGMAICGAGMASPARMVRVWPDGRRPKALTVEVVSNATRARVAIG